MTIAWSGRRYIASGAAVIGGVWWLSAESACSTFSAGEDPADAGVSPGAEGSTAETSSPGADSGGDPSADGGPFSCRDRPFGEPTAIPLPASVLGKVRAYRIAAAAGAAIVSTADDTIVSFLIDASFMPKNEPDIVLNTGKIINHAMPNADASTIFFQSREAAQSPPDIRVAVRTADGYLADAEPVIPALVAETHFSAEDPWLVSESVMYYAGDVGATGLSEDVFKAMAVGGSWAQGRTVTEVATPAEEGHPVVTPDELDLFLSAKRGDDPELRVYEAKRKANEPFGTATRIELALGGAIHPTWVADDGCTLLVVAGGNVLRLVR